MHGVRPVAEAAPPDELAPRRGLLSRVRRAIPRDLIGYSLIGCSTFLLDLLLLAGLRAWTPAPLPVAVTIAYVIAFVTNFVLNRKLNFRSHAPVGRQALRYGVVVIVDYGLTLGVTTGLSTLGVDFRIARVLAASCVAVFSYAACRWWVFRAAEPSPPSESDSRSDDASYAA